MAELIASGTTEATSADFALTDGQSATVFLKAARGPVLPGGLHAAIQVKSGSQYFTIGGLNSENLIQVIQAAGTYRIFKPASQSAFGVDRG